MVEISRRRFLAWSGAGAATTVLCGPGAAASAAEPAVRIRPEVKSLNATEWNTYVNAIKALRDVNGTDQYSRLVATQYNNAPYGHGVPAFFPWQREYLHRFELALRDIDPQVTLPYWDWSRDAAAPQTSVVLGNSMFGGRGAADGVVVDGQFANWRLVVPNAHDLRRTTRSTIGPFYSSAAIERILAGSRTYDQLRQGIEANPNGTFHAAIGGNNGDMAFMFSPNDPLFWSHAAFMDLLWAEWQARNPSLAHTYDGGNGVRPGDTLIPFNVRVSDTFDTRSSRYGYAYPRWSGSGLTPSEG